MTSLSTWTQERWGEVYRSLDAKSRKRALRASDSRLLERAIKELARPNFTRGGGTRSSRQVSLSSPRNGGGGGGMPDNSGRVGAADQALVSDQAAASLAPSGFDPSREPLWYLTKDGDATLLALYERHYSAYEYKDGRTRSQFVGPGEHIVLRTDAGDAGFVWRRFIDDSGERGVNCAFFRNESPHKSSEFIRQACAIADFAWPGARLYTFVDPEAVRSAHPGSCFMAARWKRLKHSTGSGKRILALRLRTCRDSDGSPEGGDACGSVRSTTVRAGGIAP